MYLGPSLSHARSVALVLNPRTDHVSPQFHVKFDDCFEMVWDKSTDLDAPELEWKYLSRFAVRKGHPAPVGKGLTSHLLVPQRGPITAVTNPSSQETMARPAKPQQEQPIPDIQEEAANIPEDPLPVHQPPPSLPHPQTAQPHSAACQTCSG